MEAHETQPYDPAHHHGSRIISWENIMQDNVDICTRSLTHAIHDSREYREYENIKKKLKDKPDLKEQINQFRKECYKLQNTGDDGDLYERVAEFTNKYAQFQREPLVDDYLKCELAVCRMLQEVAAKVVEAVDLELDDIAWEIRK